MREDAEDLTQAFFAKFLEKNYLEGLSAERGKFRAFLLAALKHFLAKEWDKAGRQKRGGGVQHLSLDWQQADERFHFEPPDHAMGAGFTDLAGSSAVADSTALALNSYQQVVGGTGGSAFVHLTGWSQWQDLNGLIPSGTDWLLLASANDINDRGEITGWGWRLGPEGAVYRAFLLTPVP